MTITELAIKRPTIIVVIFSALMVLGLYSFTKLNYELLPKISPPVITIATIYPGASPNEVETSVTKPIEDAISTLDQIDAVTRSEEHTSELQSLRHLVCRLLIEKKKNIPPISLQVFAADIQPCTFVRCRLL